MKRLQMAPDSVHLTALDGNQIPIGRTMRYLGTRVTGGIPVVASTDTLRQNADEFRIVGADVSAPATGNASIRPVNVRVRGFYPGVVRDTLVSYEVVQLHLSDTTATRFGQGWQLAEVSRLVFGQSVQGVPAAVWVSGDGSYVIFRQVGGVWVSPAGESATLLDSLAFAGLAARYVISLTNGATIGFRFDGWQQWTADLLGNRTRFWYANSGVGRLDSIVDPANIGYRFTYGTNGQVSDIWVRHGSGALTKVTTLIYGGTAQRLSQVKIWRSIGDLGNVIDSTKFAYATQDSYGAYLDTVIDPRHTAVKPIRSTFTYDSLFAVVTSVMRPPENSGLSLVATLWDPWRRTLPRAGRGVDPAAPAERTISASQLVGTHIGFGRLPVDFTVDRFGSPTYVRQFATASSGTGDDVRRIVRDSLGRVLRITHAPDSASIADSVVYRYNAFNRVDRLIRNTLAHPITSSLDTITFTYDSVSLTEGVRCHRIRSMRDAMGGITKANYDTAGAGVRPCLVIHAIGLAADTTRFFYSSSLLAGDLAGARPVLVRDPNGLQDSVQYDAQTWNSAVHVRKGNGATSRMYFDLFGHPDHVLDPVGTRTDLRYDFSGRLLRSKTGDTSATAPTSATFYVAGSLVDRVEVYRSGSVDDPPVGTVQVTHYYYDRLGQLDSMVTPSGRRLAYAGRDGFGNPTYEYPGNSTRINRIFDWAGRPTYENPAQVDPNQPLVDDQAFAVGRADSVYKTLGLLPGVTLSPGQVHGTTYDSKGRVASTVSRQGAESDSLVAHRYGYTRVGALIADTITFRGGARVIRTFEYNRRGQRTLARDTILLVGTGTLYGTKGGTMRYHYNSATARMDSLVSASSSNKVARVRLILDRGGRDSVRVVRLGSGSGYASDSLKTTFLYDAAGRINSIVDASIAGVWHQFSSAAYNQADHLKFAQVRTPGTGNGPAGTYVYTSEFDYDSTGGTWRLLEAIRSGGSVGSDTYGYDVFGNRTSAFYNHGTGPGCDLFGNDISTFGLDNELQRTSRSESGCTRAKRYWHDAIGNRLVQLDTNSAGSSLGPQSVLSYTAKSELFFSMSWTIQIGTYDYNWHWYDGAGRRIITQRKTGSTWNPPSVISGPSTYYVYDGANVTLTLTKSGTGPDWWTRARYVTGGVDQVLAGRFATSSGDPGSNLALIADRQGSTLAAMKSDGTQEANVKNFSRDPFGGLPGVGGSEGSVNTETGYTGASTPNGAGGFTYLRNRWYDPQTGRFLTQDPIGLAGGVNLYSYAGNNPVTFTDPFGLKADTIDVQIHEVKILGVGTGKYHASIRITPDNQERWAKDPRFQQGADGRVFATLGSAASASGFTVSNLNRPTDTAPHSLKQAINPGPAGEDATIEKLFALDAAYQDNTIYSPGGPNSNSWAAGLLNAANLHRPAFPYPMPGYNAPIPARRFGVP